MYDDVSKYTKLHSSPIEGQGQVNDHDRDPDFLRILGLLVGLLTYCSVVVCDRSPLLANIYTPNGSKLKRNRCIIN